MDTRVTDVSSRKRLVYFERWADSVAEQILGREPDIELVRLSLADAPKKIWEALAGAHGYQWPRPPYRGSRELIERAPKLLAMASQGSGCDVMDFPACNDAGVTRRAYRQCAEGAAVPWIDILRGKRPPRLVNPEVWPKYQQRYMRVMRQPLVA